MEAASPQPAAVSPTAASHRRSGRVSRKPELLVDQLATKRKRAGGDDAGDDDDGEEFDDDDDDDVPSDDPDDGDASDGAPPKPRRKRTKTGPPARRSAKKPRQNGDAVHLVMRPANQKPTKARRKKAARFTDAANASGLYCS